MSRLNPGTEQQCSVLSRFWALGDEGGAGSSNLSDLYQQVGDLDRPVLRFGD